MALLVCLAAFGCRTRMASEARPLTKQELRGLFARAQDPRRSWITVHRADSGLTFTGQNRMHKSQLAGLRFESREHPEAPVIYIRTSRKRKFTALFDTTSARSWLTPDAFAAMNGAPLGPPAYRLPARHIAEEEVGYAGVVNKVLFDKLNMDNALFCAWDKAGPMGPLARGIRQPRIDCVIGLDMIQSFHHVQIDYPLRTVYLSAGSGYAPDENLLVASVPYHEIAGALAVHGKINGEPATILVDTAGDFVFAADEEAFTTVRQLDIGNLVFRNVEADDPEDYDVGLRRYPRIGRKLLQRFRVTIDSEAKIIHFEKPDLVKR